jgi:hypothetical protein
LNKLYVRPWILENELSGFALILTNSIPNFFEAIIVSLILTGILLQIRLFYLSKTRTIKDIYVYILSFFLASIYVISQELKFHNLGGNNIYDPYDLVASIIGLMLTFGVIQLFGFINKLETEIRDKD